MPEPFTPAQYEAEADRQGYLDETQHLAAMLRYAAVLQRRIEEAEQRITLLQDTLSLSMAMNNQPVKD